MTEKKENRLISIIIPAHIGEKIQERIAGTEFTTVSDYVSFVLGEVISDTGGEGEKKVSFTREDEEQVKAKLRALGYID